MIKKILYFFITFIILLASSLKANSNKFYLAKEGKEVTLDGKLDESIWQKGKWVNNFTLLGTDKEPSQKTEFCVFYNEQNIYIGVKCHERKMDFLCENVKVHDGSVWNDDCIEIFLAPTSQFYYHFIVNSIGTKYEETRNGANPNPEWNGSWEVAIFKDKTYWSVEILIPFSTIKAIPGENKIWGFNVCRERYATGPIELSCWENTIGAEGFGFTNPDIFGNFVFEGFDFNHYIEKKYLTPLKKKLKELNDLLKKSSPSVVKKYQEELDDCSSRLTKIKQSLQKKITAAEMNEISQSFDEVLKKIEKMLNYLYLEPILE